jgi:hypothetical protein
MDAPPPDADPPDVDADLGAHHVPPTPTPPVGVAAVPPTASSTAVDAPTATGEGPVGVAVPAADDTTAGIPSTSVAVIEGRASAGTSAHTTATAAVAAEPEAPASITTPDTAVTAAPTDNDAGGAGASDARAEQTGGPEAGAAARPIGSSNTTPADRQGVPPSTTVAAEHAATADTAPIESDLRSLLARAELQRVAGRRLDVAITTTDLGQVTVSAVDGSDGLQLHLTSDQADGRSRLVQHLDELRADLADHGVGFDSLGVGTGTPGHPDRDDTSAQAPAPDPTVAPAASTVRAEPDARPASPHDGLDVRI